MVLRRLVPLAAVMLIGFQLSHAQAQPSGVDDAFVQKQFGQTCKVLQGPQPMTGDLDADGVEDIVIPARCTNPLLDQSEDNFRVVDPYNSFFGYGNPKITTEFASEDKSFRGTVLLIIHGQGPEAWHAATPKAKFVIINLPFKQVVVRKLTQGKRSLTAIYAEETGPDRMTSVLFWDGKKYKYNPLGASMED